MSEKEKIKMPEMPSEYSSEKKGKVENEEFEVTKKYISKANNNSKRSILPLHALTSQGSLYSPSYFAAKLNGGKIDVWVCGEIVEFDAAHPSAGMIGIRNKLFDASVKYGMDAVCTVRTTEKKNVLVRLNSDAIGIKRTAQPETNTAQPETNTATQ